MKNAVLEGLSLVGPIGRLIIGGIVAILLGAIGVVLSLEGRYASLQKDLRRRGGPYGPFEHTFLNRIVRERHESSLLCRRVSARGIVEHAFETELGPLLLGERFVERATSLVIVLGTLGTFNGLTASVGTLLELVSSDGSRSVDLTQVLTSALPDALSAMSIAFATLFFGILAALLLTLLNVAFSVRRRRTALITAAETYLELAHPYEPLGEQALSLGPVSELRAGTAPFDEIVVGLADSVMGLDRAVARFDSALQSFASTTKEFREFNTHLEDNVQRMSVSFADFSEELRTGVERLKSMNRN